MVGMYIQVVYPSTDDIIDRTLMLCLSPIDRGYAIYYVASMLSYVICIVHVEYVTFNAEHLISTVLSV